MKRILFALALMLAPHGAYAQMAKPIEQVPTGFAPAPYNFPLAVFARDTGVIGPYIGVFEQHADGNWYGCSNNPPPSTEFDNEVAALGPLGKIQKDLPALNNALARCYPPIGSGPPVNASNVQRVNYALGVNFQLRPDGNVEVLTAK